MEMCVAVPWCFLAGVPVCAGFWRWRVCGLAVAIPVGCVYTLKVLFFRIVPCFFRFAGGIRVCSAGALLGFSEMLSRAQMGGGLFFSV